MIFRLLRSCLAGLGFIPKSDLVARIVSRHPDMEEVVPGELVVVRDGIDKWACFRCPGGCGECIKLSLNPKRRPRWSTTVDWLGRPTVSPSIRQTSDCRCHFWVREGQVSWCEDSGHGKSSKFSAP